MTEAKTEGQKKVSPHRPIGSFIKLSLFSLLFIWLVVTAWEVYRFLTSPIGTHAKVQPTVIEISPNQTPKGLAAELAKKGLMPHPDWLVYWMRWQGLDRKLRFGEYRVNPQWTVSELMTHLLQDAPVQYEFTLVPGMTFKTLWQKIRQLPKLQHVPDLTPEKLAAQLKLIGNPKVSGAARLEGQFLPETYAYVKWGDSDLQLLKRMHQAMQQFLMQQWSQSAPNLPLKTPYEALILASIVEKETGKASERPLIAGVFINRLKKRMRLQSDPTVIYGMGDAYDGNIRKKDLRTKTAYNTYRMRGLPPTPICMPSKAAMLAVLHPAKTQALYFVGKGNGEHQFSNTLKQHNRAVYRYQKRPH